MLILSAHHDSSMTGARDLRDGSPRHAWPVIPVTGARWPSPYYTHGGWNDANEAGDPGSDGPRGGCFGAGQGVAGEAGGSGGGGVGRRGPPRPALRVLQHPYDLSSFYRAGESPLGPWAGLPNDPAYKIADFYRSHAGGYPGTPHGWSAFWTNGYRAARSTPLRPYRRMIGENGDLFLAVPFLAPIGPISGAFAEY